MSWTELKQYNLTIHHANNIRLHVLLYTKWTEEYTHMYTARNYMCYVNKKEICIRFTMLNADSSRAQKAVQQ